MGYYKLVTVAIATQIALILLYINHRSSLRHLHYQYQKAEQRYQELIKQKERLSQQLQSDHNYTRILETAQKKGMQTIPFDRVKTAKQESS